MTSCVLWGVTSRYASYRDLIDEQLLAARNKIAHGEEEYIRLTDWDDLREEIIKMMDDISTQVLNSATQKSYLVE
ncbi:MAE_28990/MAE_18760 family HEPN-like nuclease [Streptomyces griseus]